MNCVLFPINFNHYDIYGDHTGTILTLSRECPVSRVRGDIDCSYNYRIMWEHLGTRPHCSHGPASHGTGTVTRDTWTPTLLDISSVSTVSIVTMHTRLITALVVTTLPYFASASLTLGW